jgi:hypothetical protein
LRRCVDAPMFRRIPAPNEKPAFKGKLLKTRSWRGNRPQHLLTNRWLESVPRPKKTLLQKTRSSVGLIQIWVVSRKTLGGNSPLPSFFAGNISTTPAKCKLCTFTMFRTQELKIRCCCNHTWKWAWHKYLFGLYC